MKPKKESYRTGEYALTPEQVNRLLSCITDLSHRALLELAISAGIRREDIVNIKAADVNYEDQSVIYYERKKKRTRKVFIPLNVANALEMQKKNIGKSEYLFPGRMYAKGRKIGHLAGRTAYNILQMYLFSAGLPKRPFHALRSTCYKLCCFKGWTAAQAAKHIGDTVKVAQEHYATPSEQELKTCATEKSIL